MKRTFAVYAGVAVFCTVLFLIYDRFSHDVRSPYMTFLFGLPILLGVVPFMILAVRDDIRRPGRLAFNLYNSGVAAIIVSSMLKGIFEIAGTGSPLQSYLNIFGIVLAASGFAAYVLEKYTS